MSCGNPFNHLLKNVKGSFLNHELFSTSKPKYDDDVIECMQFGICSVRPKPLKEIPYYYHFWSSHGRAYEDEDLSWIRLKGSKGELQSIPK